MPTCPPEQDYEKQYKNNNNKKKVKKEPELFKRELKIENKSPKLQTSSIWNFSPNNHANKFLWYIALLTN